MTTPHADPASVQPSDAIDALRTIAEFPVTDMLLNMDAANMRRIAQEALARFGTRPAAEPAPLTPEEHQVLRSAVRDSAEVVAPGRMEEQAAATWTPDQIEQVEKEAMEMLGKLQASPRAPSVEDKE